MANNYTDPYINKVYESVAQQQAQQLATAERDIQRQLTEAEASITRQTQDNLKRVDVEDQKIRQAYTQPKLSAAAQQQASLSLDNQQKANRTAMQTAGDVADAEIDRQRDILAAQYSSAIKQAQKANDMALAQSLYQQAAAEDARLSALRTAGAKLMAGAGDNSGISQLAAGTPSGAAGSTGPLEQSQYADMIQRIYDDKNQIQQEQAQLALAEQMSEIDAMQQERQRQTDKDLTDVYVSALKNNASQNEVENASGMGSGTKAQRALSRAVGMTEDLTALRGVQAEADAALEAQRVDAVKGYREALLSGQHQTEQQRAQALLAAAENEKEQRFQEQLAAAEALAKQGDYSLLGKLYGLTDEQLQKLQQPQDAGPGTPGNGNNGTLNAFLEAYYGNEYDIGKDIQLTQEEAAALAEKLQNAEKISEGRKEQDAFLEALLAAAKEDARKGNK